MPKDFNNTNEQVSYQTRQQSHDQKSISSSSLFYAYSNNSFSFNSFLFKIVYSWRHLQVFGKITILVDTILRLVHLSFCFFLIIQGM